MIPPSIALLIPSSDPARILEAVAGAFGCKSGTIHRVRDGERVLVGFRKLPPVMMEAIQTVPFGEGIGGLASERREPVCRCNFQTDESGRARPGARLSGLEGAIAVPLIVEGERWGCWAPPRGRRTPGLIASRRTCWRSPRKRDDPCG